MRISFSDILYFESRKRIVVLFTKNQAIEFYGKLNDVLARLPSDSFLRCHQSYIVNLNGVKVIDKINRRMIIDNNKSIEISKSYYTQVVEKFTK